MKVTAIIPARYESTRLPGKLLENIGSQSILQRVYKQAKLADVFDDIIVATDHQLILDHCHQMDMKAVLTSNTHISGTDRIAEAATKLDSEIIINIQGDEPFIETECIQELVDLLKKPDVQIGTLFKILDEKDHLFDYNVVKLVKDISNRILYFSRQAIPALRDLPYKKWHQSTNYFQHLGVYGFKREALLEIVKLQPSGLELSEKLEQLRWLENGYSIFGAQVQSTSFGIDTQEDLDKARERYK